MSFRLKTILGVAIIEAVLLSFLIMMGLEYLGRSNIKQLEERAENIAQLFSTTVANDLFASDLASLESHVQELLKNKGIMYARVKNDIGQVLAEHTDKNMETKLANLDTNFAEIGDGIYDVSSSVEAGGFSYGSVEIGISTANLSDLFNEAQYIGFTIAAVEMAMVAMFSFLLGTYLTRQLSTLVVASKKIEEGDYNYRIKVKGSDELAATAKAFNSMSQGLLIDKQRRLAVDNVVQEGIVTLNSKGEIQSTNPACEHLFRLNAEALLSLNIVQLLPDLVDLEDFIQRNTDESSANLSKPFLLQAVDSNYSYFPVEARINVLNLAEDKQYILLIYSLRERIKIEQVERDRAVAHAREKTLEISNRQLQDFAYIASHDLQEPVRKILAFGDRLLQKHGQNLDDQGLDYLQRMLNAGQRMRLLISGLLEYSRVETQAKRFVLVDLDIVFEEVLSNLELKISETRAIINIDGSFPKIQADHLQMQQLFQNLIGNSIKYRKDAIDPVISITHELLKNHKIIDDPEPKRDYLKVFVTDNGIGFDQKYAERIFHIFERIHGRSEYEGTGIGLAICYRIIERHRGTIKADSIEGDGSTFTILLPIENITINHQEVT